MLDRIETAFQSGNYPEITQLLGTLDETDPWTQFYRARLWEETGKSEQAESTYRSLLRQAANQKLALAHNIH